MAASAVPLLLGILRDGPSYGYAIASAISEQTHGEITWSEGMLYPLLHRLEKQGHIEARWGVAETGRRRKYYHLTTSGRKELASHLAQWNIVTRAISNISDSSDSGGDHDGT